MAGIRVGTLYTENRDLVEAAAKLGAFHGLPGTTQKQVAQLLQDRGVKRNGTTKHDAKMLTVRFSTLVQIGLTSSICRGTDPG